MPAEAGSNPEPILGDKNSPSGRCIACLGVGRLGKLGDGKARMQQTWGWCDGGLLRLGEAGLARPLESVIARDQVSGNANDEDSWPVLGRSHMDPCAQDLP